MTATTTTKGSHIKRQARRPDGRVVSTYSDAQLYELVRKAAFKARPDQPAKLSVRKFDESVASLGYTDAPSARAICARLKRGWPEIVEIAIAPKQSVQKKDAPQKSDEAKWLTERHLFFALNAVADFKGIETMTEHAYDAYLAEYLAARRQPAHILGPGARFPTSSQILRLAVKLPAKGGAAKPWDRALVFAGLKPVVQSPSNALTVIEAINLYIEATLCEFYPSHEELTRLRSEFGISIREKEEGKKWSESLQEALDGRAAAGLPVPSMIAAVSSKVALVLPPGFKTPKVKNAKGTWAEKTDEEMVEAITPYVLDCLNRTPPVRPTKKDYQSWASGRKEAPSGDTLGLRKNWGEWVKLVEEQLLEAKKAA
jgi:hypothetical protein